MHTHCHKFLLALALATGLGACAAQPAHTKTAEPAPPVARAAAPQPQSIVSGTITLADGADLPKETTVEVALLDASLADAPSSVIASQILDVRQPVTELPFSIAYDPAKVDPRANVTLSARLLRHGKLEHLTTESYPALTHGQPSEGFVLRLKPAN